MNRSIRNLGVLVFLSAMFLLVLNPALQAQTYRGTILGTVTDSSGGAIAGATVTIKNLDTGLLRTVTTSDDGSYAAPELPIGNYSVTVEKSGFKEGVVTGLRVEVSTERRADFALQPGELAQKVEVTGEALPQVESTSDTLGGIVESKVVTSLPVNGRDYQKLIFLVPGVTGSPDQITDSPGSFGIFSINGARGRANNFLLDGTDMNDGYRNDPAINEAGTYGTPATILPVEAIAELRVASNFEAEYGRSAGGVINVVTKSGTNQLHGSALEYFRNTDLNARNYFNPAADEPGGQPQEPFHNNQFGGSLGGPIIKDRDFFFVDYEGVRESGKLNYSALVPSAQELAIASQQVVFDGFSGVNPVVSSLLAMHPWPTPSISTTPFSDVNNAFVATPFLNNINNGIVKIDHNFNQNNLLTGRYYIGDSEQSFPLGLVGGSLLPGYNVTTPTRVQMIALSYVSVINPSMVNEARLGWNRFAEGFFPEDRSFNPASIGMDTGVDAYNYGLPRINVGSYAQIGANYTTPRQRVDTNWHFIDNISWKAGKHDIKFGYEFRRTSISQILNIDFRGKLAFSGTPFGGPCAAIVGDQNQCQALAYFLEGTPTSGSIASGNTNRNTFQNSDAVYFQDSYHVTHSFTLNLGLRYDYYGLLQDKQENLTNILLDQATQLATPTVIGAGRLYQPDYRNVAPRVSIAWDVFGKQKTVVRAGYGVFFDAYSQDAFIGQVPYNSLFDPGAAYSGFGPNPIYFASATGAAFGQGVPVFGGAAPMPDGFAVNPNLRTPYMQNFNLNLQQQVAHKMVFEIGYVGSNGHKLLQTVDANQPTQAMITAADLACDCINNGSPNYVPRFYTSTNPNYNFFYLNYLESSANSNYNSLQTSFRVNDWHGLTTTLNYTWSHSIDDASDSWEYVPNASTPNETYGTNPNRGNSNFDVRNRLAWNFIYQIPDSQDSHLKALRNGWGINGIVTVQSGQPFQFNYNFEDDYDGSGSYYGVPDIVGPVHYNQSNPNQFINLDAFAVPCTPVASGFDGTASSCTPGTRHYGNLGRNSLIGPHFRQFDFSVFKDTHLTERLNMQLRFEAYNLFNHPNFANPYLPYFIADPSINGATPNGRYQGFYPLTATGDVGIGYPFLGSGGPRSMQVAAKFTF
ncbi:MAG TPA: TonB-dependent receptor [Candidatus Sulfotelmatobacter sp.]|nr:TonB-dependent receptor [Candidatus Sulfotelmatobacter sp.]